jgi:hypothetical protein
MTPVDVLSARPRRANEGFRSLFIDGDRVGNVIIEGGRVRMSILLRQYLTFFHRGLVERIDAEQMRGDDRPA